MGEQVSSDGIALRRCLGASCSSSPRHGYLTAFLCQVGRVKSLVCFLVYFLTFGLWHGSEAWLTWPGGSCSTSTGFLPQGWVPALCWWPLGATFGQMSSVGQESEMKCSDLQGKLPRLPAQKAIESCAQTEPQINRKREENISHC